MGVSAVGLFLPAALFLGLLLHPGPNTAWGIMASGVMLGLIFLLSLRGLRTAIFRSIAVWRIGPDGLIARSMGMTGRTPWRDVYDMRSNGSILFVDIADWTLELRIPADLTDGEMGDIGEFRSRHGVRGVPMVSQSYLGVGMWFALAVIMLSIASICLLVVFRPDAGAGTLRWTLVAIAIAVAALCRGMAMVTERVAIGPDHIERLTCFGRVLIPLGEVRLLTHRRPAVRAESPRRRTRVEYKGLIAEEASGANRTPGRIAVASGRGRIGFTTRALPFDSLAPGLMDACSQAATLDDWTGEVTPPDDTNSVQTVRDAAAFCRSARKRYIALGLLQIVFLPAIFILWIAALVAGFIFINCSPFTLDTAIDSFKKAANVKRTCAQFSAM